MRRVVVLGCLALAVAAASPTGLPAAAPPPTSWADPQIQTVVAAGLMAPSVSDFRPGDPLLAGELGVVLASLGAPEVVVDDPLRPVTLRELDAQLVSLAGLRPSARALRLAAAYAGLTPRPWLGTETVARLLGLRVNHVRAQEELELPLSAPATRAEAAYSVARILTIRDDEIAAVREAVDWYVFPELTTWQQTILRRALRFVGSPYVWAGTSERPQELFGKRLPGGFDCSGLVWRVYKLEPFAGGAALANVLRGRTTYDMSGEVPRSLRIPRESLEPGDLAFFGQNGPRSKPSEVGHMGIYAGNGWMVHSSDRGTTLIPLTGWYETRFAWGRRPLAEAGLS
jgi:cell wall-associated NlpC family hydrolase